MGLGGLRVGSLRAADKMMGRNFRELELGMGDLRRLEQDWESEMGWA